MKSKQTILTFSYAISLSLSLWACAIGGPTGIKVSDDGKVEASGCYAPFDKDGKQLFYGSGFFFKKEGALKYGIFKSESSSKQLVLSPPDGLTFEDLEDVEKLSEENKEKIYNIHPYQVLDVNYEDSQISFAYSAYSGAPEEQKIGLKGKLVNSDLIEITSGAWVKANETEMTKLEKVKCMDLSKVKKENPLSSIDELIGGKE